MISMNPLPYYLNYFGEKHSIVSIEMKVLFKVTVNDFYIYSKLLNKNSF